MMTKHTAAPPSVAVRLVGVKGSALFEVRRLLSGWVYMLGTEATTAPSPIVAVLCGDAETILSVPRDVLVEPVLFVGLRRTVSFSSIGGSATERYELADAVVRLSLLARIASLAAYHKTNGELASGLRRDVYERHSVYKCVATIQRVFSLHITEQELLDHVGISESSLYRLFQQEGGLSPSRLFQWVRMHEMAKRLSLNESAEKVAEGLGFEHAQSARRTMHKLTKMGMRQLRSERGLIEFERRMASVVGAKSP